MGRSKDRHLDTFGFVSARGKNIVNGKGKEILLRGVGLGSWFLPEGYMWCFPQGGDRPRKIEKMILDLVGKEESDNFWNKYYDTYITEDDIRLIAEEGFNSIRLPINYRYIQSNAKAIERVDNLVEWCRKYSLYVILDLHGAPGGQTGTNIDDSEFDKPELFTHEANIRKTISFWREMAERYKDEWIIAGYDLLNEPLPEWFSRHNGQVIPLYKKIIQAIREVDKKHMIILEGVHWATDWSIFTEKLDDNLMLQFHKYWNNPDRESIQAYLDKREELNVPIFMGEGGENNGDWYVGAFRLFEDLNISWNFWTWKKMDTTNSPVSIVKPDEWELLINYLEGGPKPDRDKALSIFSEYLGNLDFKKCLFRPEIVRSIMCRAPLRIPAVFYSYKKRGKGIMTNITESETQLNFRKNDNIKFGFSHGHRISPNFQHGRGEQWQNDEWMHVTLNRGDWLTYNFRTDCRSSDIVFTVSLKIRSIPEEGVVKLTIDALDFEEYYLCSSSWTTAISSKSFRAGKGLKRLTLSVEKGPVQIERINIETV